MYEGFEDQEKYLEDAKRVVKEQAYFMKKALDSANLRDALRCASVMLSELRTSLLGPRSYYSLYMQIFDELRVLEQYFKEEYRRGRRMVDLYESVQHAQQLLPRLYLLITVGSVYIGTQEIIAREILSDLLEMIKAVQNPLRGLFIRYYFLKMCKDKLPDAGNEYEGEGGDIKDSINCILNNLAEMNKLWIRMQMGSKDKPKREQERVDLKVTVGENLHRLSGLDGVTLEVYQEEVLPKLLELIIHCNDTISQQYLIDCLIQAFPDEYHLTNLQTLLETFTSSLQPSVDIKMIFIRLMERLADFAKEQQQAVSQINDDINIYSMFKQHIDRIITDNRVQIELARLLDLQAAFLKFTLGCYPKNSEYVNEILKSCCVICERYGSKNLNEECQVNIVKFLTLPLETMSLVILSMNEYPNLMQYLPFIKRRKVANKIVYAVTQLQAPIDKITIAQQFLTFISPLLTTQQDYCEISALEFEEEQQLVAKMLHLVNVPENPFQTYEILNLFQEKLIQGEIRRMKYTLPSLIFCYLKFVFKCFFILLLRITKQMAQIQNESFNQKNFLLMIKSLIHRIDEELPETSLKLYLNLVMSINEFDHQQELSNFTYDLFVDAMTIYEEKLSDSRSKNRAILLFSGTLEKLQCLNEEDYLTLGLNITQYAGNLAKRNEKCIGILKCTHLFYNNSFKNQQELVKQFTRCIKFANVCFEQSPEHLYLYIQIVNKYLYFFYQFHILEQLNKEIENIITLLEQKMPTIEKVVPQDQIAKLQIYWMATKTYMNEKKVSKAQVQAVQEVQGVQEVVVQQEVVAVHQEAETVESTELPEQV